MKLSLVVSYETFPIGKLLNFPSAKLWNFPKR